MPINVEVLAAIDLNLMVTFLVIYQEQSLTRAAFKLGVGQPAISGALKRLRVHFGDPLFVRNRFGVTPTEKAHNVAYSLTPAIRRIEKVIKGASPSALD
ncbi:LysR family transcriptional regulator [Pseudomonas gingeri]|uniref:LysR family transcriptional regulator n=1 Tax=Pseudomonas gingeri TaxID=117681 RepID=UPI0015A4C546|nr:LysR family transcriptional regulator [Pseudomonas gingeri]NWA29760.1 LysR family transcriptional regulator [Pseudomonas gingeri]